MQFEYGKAPMTYIDGVPAFKAGEWPGLKSCRFHSYKRVIRSMSQGVFFNENEPPILPKRKLLGPPPSKEYKFVPCCKMVTYQKKEKKIEGIKYIAQYQRPPRIRPEKRHLFPYKEEKELKQRERVMTPDQNVQNELRLMSHYGFTNKKYINMTNQKLMGVTFNKEPFGKIRMNDDSEGFMNNKGMTREQRRAYIENKRKNEEMENKRDAEYVSNLGQWEKKNLINFKGNKNNDSDNK